MNAPGHAQLPLANREACPEMSLGCYKWTSLVADKASGQLFPDKASGQLFPDKASGQLFPDKASGQLSLTRLPDNFP